VVALVELIISDQVIVKEGRDIEIQDDHRNSQRKRRLSWGFAPSTAFIDVYKAHVGRETDELQRQQQQVALIIDGLWWKL